ncbi:hypothetical protein VPH35_013424 [Triticum aestivum]
MSTNYDALLDEITQHIRQLWGECNGQQNGMVEGILSLPQGAGKFIIAILAPQHWVRNNSDPVRLLFSFHNLYCDGFHQKGKWYLFKDIYLKMQKGGEIAGTNVRSLGFTGNYSQLGPAFSSISLGGYALFQLYRCIAEFPGLEIKPHLKLGVVSFSEAIRFPLVRQYIRNDVQWLSNHFQDWSVYCEKIRDGRDAFEAIPGIDTFDDLLALVIMIL